MKKGFTLVELSIVLVIIGLLIGGILVARSMVDTAKITNAVRQIQQYDIAVSNFQENFKQLPGDSNLFAPEGNNDGDSNDVVTGGIPDCNYYSCLEYYSFWKHLTDSGMLKGSYNNDFTNYFVANLNAPKFLQVEPRDPDSSNAPEGDNNFLWAANFTAQGNTTKIWFYKAILSPYQATVLDVKMDNGNLSAGSFKAFNSDSLGDCDASDGGYSISVGCYIDIQIGATNGNPLTN